ncbi:hypothetical protein LTR64_005226 [Lithohypha guttulata]|uniref:uncharacterized protein n=1 Tax=Lithohypha guttulata TaxID=1690604 RepID=UPI002DE13CF1|nr:hypothetical protein LTR51_002982 [Lithohypha guttulata]
MVLDFLYSQIFVTPAIPTTPLPGQTLIITGSNTGLGLAAATHIACLKPALLILAVRNQAKGNAARDTIYKDTGLSPEDVKIEVWDLDMSSFASVLAFSDRCANDLYRLDGVSLNAGITMAKLELMEGYESTIAVNVISTFLLAITLLPTLRKSAMKHNITPRLSIVGSETHVWAPWKESTTPEGTKILEAMSAPGTKVSQARYMDSKLMQILVFRHLCSLFVAQQLPENAKVILNILNPGFCYSDLGRDSSPLVQTVMRYFLARTQEVGGRPIAAGLVAGLETDGKYMHDGVVAEGALSRYVKSEKGEEMGKRLWEELREVFEQARPGVVGKLWEK